MRVIISANIYESISHEVLADELFKHARVSRRLHAMKICFIYQKEKHKKFKNKKRKMRFDLSTNSFTDLLDDLIE